MSFKTITISCAALALAVPALALAEDTPASNAANTCKAIRTAAGAANFKAAYGTNKNKSNAFGKCVSAQTKIENAAAGKAKSTCKAEQSDPNFAANHGGKTFAQFYGTGKKGANAYGKCTSAAAKAAHSAETSAKVNAAKACKAERKSLGADAFAAKYGTNKNKKNAFGKCVSKLAKKPYNL
jgi:hypothetical protein